MHSPKEVINKRYEDAAYAYGVGQFEEALAGFSELAESGHAMATTYLAHFGRAHRARMTLVVEADDACCGNG